MIEMMSRMSAIFDLYSGSRIAITVTEAQATEKTTAQFQIPGVTASEGKDRGEDDHHDEVRGGGEQEVGAFPHVPALRRLANHGEPGVPVKRAFERERRDSHEDGGQQERRDLGPAGERVQTGPSNRHVGCEGGENPYGRLGYVLAICQADGGDDARDEAGEPTGHRERPGNSRCSQPLQADDDPG